ncbi:hypothetical protein B0T17DRAFT_510279 [Bombardia bombarda]|uniref:FAD-binding domain-containing protein n=1 Tax=Bombardia bombarda TaxID=252184 RepID=A0AA40BVX2_9PEZI|nr:hypothetical protein B0T17DRAFT_510279 [Bombardia bombarda]
MSKPDTPSTVAREKEAKLKVVIVGGGIAGLTLANALERSPIPIDYVVLEARDEFVPMAGATIGVAPNGSRILDQIGLYDDVIPLLHLVSNSGLHISDDKSDGRSLTGDSRLDFFSLTQARTGYAGAFVERKELLEIMVRHIGRKECLLTDKSVCAVEQDEDGATVICADGTKYRGDVVVGADGIRSKTRAEMWRAVAEEGKVDMEKEREVMTAEYQCVFGISKPVPGLDAGSNDITHSEGVSTLVVTGNGGRVYWFLFGRMDRVYKMDEIPRFSALDAEAFAKKHSQLAIRPQGLVKLGHLWEAREHATLIALEEGDFAHWTAGRIVCLGDAVHKMTPNNGSGGNLAMESAAALANELYRLAANTSTPHQLTTRRVQESFQRFQRRMHPRAKEFIKTSAFVTRIQALVGFKERFIVNYFYPYMGDFPINISSDVQVGAPRIDYLPVPPRSLAGNMPYNPSQGFENHERVWIRALLALPLLLAAAWADKNMVPGAEFNQPERGLVASYGVFYAIMLIESARRANHYNILRFALIWGILAIHHPTVTIPFYFAILYILTPIATFKASDMRLTNISYATTVLPTFLVFLALTYYTSSSPSSQSPSPIYISALFPLLASLTQHLLTTHILPPSTILSDRLSNVTRDLPTLRHTLWTISAISALLWQYNLWSSSISTTTGSILYAIFETSTTTPSHVLFTLANLVCMALLTWDLKAAGMAVGGGLCLSSWPVLALCAVSILIVGGNGTLLGLFWLWREQILATKRHKDAVVRADQ